MTYLGAIYPVTSLFLSLQMLPPLANVLSNKLYTMQINDSPHWARTELPPRSSPHPPLEPQTQSQSFQWLRPLSLLS